MIRKAQLLIAGAIAVALIAAGCGGSSSNSSSSGGTLSNDEFVAQANTICRDAQTKLATVQTDIQAKVKSDPSQVQALVTDSLTQIVPIVRDTIDRIAALDAPSDLKPKLDDFKAKTDAALNQVAADPAKALQDASSGTSPFTSLQGLAGDLGLKDCGGSSGG